MNGFEVALLVASLAGQDDAGVVIEIGHPTRVTIRRENAELGPHGPSRRFRCGVTFDGILHVFALAPDRDPYLRLASTSGGDPVEDDDAGGGKTPYLDREVRVGDEITIDVAVDVPPDAESVDVELHVESSPETAATREAADIAVRRLSELLANPPATRSELGDAMRGILDDLGTVDGAGASRLGSGAFARIGYAALHNDVPAIARDALSVTLSRADRVRPPDDVRVQELRRDLGNAFEEVGDIDNGARLRQLVFESLSRTVAADDPRVLAARVELARHDFLRARYEEAIASLRIAIPHLAMNLPRTEDLLVRACTILARALSTAGDVAGAKAEVEGLIAMRGLSGVAVLNARSMLGSVLHESGDLQRARALLESVLAECDRTYPAEHSLIENTLIELGRTLDVMGDFQGAKAVFERRIDSLKRRAPADPSLLQAARIDLSVALMMMLEYERARAIQQEVVDEQQAARPVDERGLTHSMGALATTLTAMGRWDEALPLQRRVDEARSRRVSPDDQYLLSHRLNLALTLLRSGALDEARDIAHDVLERRVRLLPPGDAMLQRARNVNLMIAAERGDHAMATTLSEGVVSDAIRGIADALLVMSPREAEQVASMRASAVSVVLGYARNVDDDERRSHLYDLAFPAIESLRSASTTSARIARRIAKTLDPDAAAALRNSIVAARLEVARLAGAGRPEELVAASRRLEAAERALREPLASHVRMEPATSGSIRAELPEDAAAVSFWAYSNQGQASAVREYYMLAFVLRRGRAPIGIELGPLTDLSAAVLQWRRAIHVEAGRGKRLEFAPNSAAGTQRDAGTAGDALRRVAFDPLRAAIGEARRLILVPDGVLHLVPFDALPEGPDSDSCLGDRYEIETRTALSDRSEPTEVRDVADETAGSGLLVLGGGIDFGPPGAGGAFDALPETGPEIDAIARLRRETFGADAAIERLAGADATKARLLALAPRARFLHLATHGEFGGAVEAQVPDASLETVRGFAPLSLCGVALAGANAPADGDGRREGILTGEEIAALDLTGCELAVLSACETSLGQRHSGQGVASLQAALRAAGARTTITSLWRVPDEATHALMVEFYRRVWVEKQPKARALWEAKRALRAQGTPVAGWAAWVMTGDPE